MGNNLSEFKEGDEVIINIKDLEVIEQMQQNHGGWNDKMKECLKGPSKLLQGLGTDVLIKGPSGAVYRVNPDLLTRYVSNTISPGTKVTMIEKEEEMKQLQSGHGGWSDGMKELLGKTVEIVQKFPDGDYKVKFDNRTWTVNPASFTTTNTGPRSIKVAVGDKLKIIENKDKVIKYQNNHGGWSNLMTLILDEEVEVVEVLEDGDCFVSKYGMKWLVNPMCFLSAQQIDNSKKKKNFQKGDTVQVCDNLEKCKELQQYHGGWVSAMKMFVGKIGTIDAVLITGDVKVKISGMSFVYNSELLTKVDSMDSSSKSKCGIVVGDTVKVSTDKRKVKMLQKDHGEWIDSMRMILGEKGKVKSIFPDGDLRVKIMGNLITLNPECVKKVEKESNSDSDDTPDVLKMMHQMAKMMGQADSDDDSDNANDSDNDLASVMNIEHMKLFAAVKSGDLELTRTILSLTGPNISKKKITALMIAVNEGHEKIVELLLSKGAETSAKDGDGDTALHIAVQKNRSDVCRILTKNGANVNEQNNMKMTPLMLASANGAQDIVRIIVAVQGVNLNIGDKDKDTALHIAIQKSRLECTEILLEAGADITALNEKLFSPFHMAVLRGHEKILEAFLKRQGPSIVDLQKEDKFAAIHLAALNNHPGCLKLLIEYKADVNIRNGKMQTALHLAVSQKYLECVKILVENRVEMNLKDDSGDTPLHDAIRGHNMDKMKQMGSMFGMSEMFQLMGGISGGTDSSEEIVLYLVRMGAKLDIKNNHHKTALEACDDSALKNKIKSCKGGVEVIQAIKSPPVAAVSNEPNAEVERLKLKIKKLEEENICVICLDRQIDCTFNCGHVSCERCAQNLFECHMCRVPIETRVKMFR